MPKTFGDYICIEIQKLLRDIRREEEMSDDDDDDLSAKLAKPSFTTRPIVATERPENADGAPKRQMIVEDPSRQDGPFDEEFSYPDDTPIETLVKDVAEHHNRATKIPDWLAALRKQDIMTVGDLRNLVDDDWLRFDLTVLASRALKNAVYGASTTPMPSSRPSTRVAPSSLSRPETPYT